MSAQDTQAGVRRHHTITATSRTARAALDTSPAAPGYDSHDYNEDEVVDHDWVGGVGAVGEKSSSLHRQASLPTGYHRGKYPKTGLLYPVKFSVFLPALP